MSIARKMEFKIQRNSRRKQVSLRINAFITSIALSTGMRVAAEAEVVVGAYPAPSLSCQSSVEEEEVAGRLSVAAADHRL